MKVLNVIEMRPGMPLRVEKWVQTDKWWEVAELFSGQRRVCMMKQGNKDVLKYLRTHKYNRARALKVTTKFFYTEEEVVVPPPSKECGNKLLGSSVVIKAVL